MRKMLSIVAGAAASFLGAQAHAVLIDFESLTAGDNVFSHMGANFGGAQVWDFGGQFSESAPNVIGDSAGGFTGDVTITFDQAVFDLSFFSGGDDDAGSQATIDIFDINGLLASVALVGDGNANTTDFQDLGAFAAITSIVIRDVTDGAGLVYDNFFFNTAGDPVPLPAAALLFPMGLAALRAAKKRKA